MSTTNLLLCAVLLLNTAAVAAYLIWGMLTARRTKKGKMLVFIRFFLMLFCPVIGILYFVCSMLFHKLLFHKKVDLSDVIFNKEICFGRIFHPKYSEIFFRFLHHFVQN